MYHAQTPQKSQTFCRWHKAQPRFIQRPKSCLNCRDTFTFDFSYNHSTMYIDERVLRRMGRGRGGAFRRLITSEKGFHILLVYTGMRVCACEFVYIYTYFLFRIFFISFSFSIHMADARKFRIKNRSQWTTITNGVSPIFSPYYPRTIF